MIRYELLADLFLYPSEELRAKIFEIKKYLDENFLIVSDSLREFSEFVKMTSLKEWEEIYTRTFDVQALTTLDLGYVVFGDDYKRGELLVNLGNEHKAASNECGTELADHLPNILRLINKTTDEEFKQDLIYYIVFPALTKILSDFNKESIDGKNKIYDKHHRTIIEQNETNRLIYRKPIKTILEIIKIEFPDKQITMPEEKEFTKEISNELEIQS
ncbi:MAG: hypothetical protein A2315_08165 [Ignavibacteria bacterium RIFOXYB2_FULL_35_12]|nr:MAG: hypothetical protein A2058_09475 [Ignavibacteria bacterium GWA2_36_19]OGU52649.1 MAG: hypothetical protein A2006_13750 [Ignavibacteria bacterium GWC2_35_8]OGU59461.1 MAG: hypothetical protein A2X60_05095 [Ignavibacteria bacterium GWF2_35_20]OGU79973.1 MAG: hypothetical protein A2254_02755 [Ignavibacteria bacterium RIFOXYA2_FULL_35_9]OGU85086.1 MAG: hypothetical protein A3K31_17860 [Ignavibacteria bacterium RIFOXYA12_FULL_35_25]OGU89329.1 MAG: hypothetical protein A2492_10660 [Ignavibac